MRGSGIRRAHEDEEPGARRRGRVHPRIERVRSEQRVDRDRVGAEAVGTRGGPLA